MDGERGVDKQKVKIFKRQCRGFQRGDPYANALGRFICENWSGEMELGDILERFELDLSMDLNDKVEVGKFIAWYHDKIEARFDAAHAAELDELNKKTVKKFNGKDAAGTNRQEVLGEMEENRRLHVEKYDFDRDGSNLFCQLMDHALAGLPEGDQRVLLVESLMEYGLHRPAVFDRFYAKAELQGPFLRAYAKNICKYLVAQPMLFERFDFFWGCGAEEMKAELSKLNWLSDSIGVAFDRYAMFFEEGSRVSGGFDFAKMKENINRMVRLGLNNDFLAGRDLALGIEKLSAIPSAKICGKEISLFENLVLEMMLSANKGDPASKRSGGLRI